MVGRYAVSSKTKEMTMNKKLLFVALLAALLAGCAHRHPRGEGDVVNQTRPQITVQGDQIAVPYALIFLGRREVTVTWQLPTDSKYRFADNGIVIEGVLVDQVVRGDRVSVVLDPRQNEIVNCRRSANGLEFSCLNRHTKPGYYKYTIRLVGDAQKPLTLDPGIMND
jgi:hypothetical protein